VPLPKCGNSCNHFTDYYYEEDINNRNKKNNATIITKANIEKNFCSLRSVYALEYQGTRNS
jgi:hypothetical protein